MSPQGCTLVLMLDAHGLPTTGHSLAPTSYVRTPGGLGVIVDVSEDGSSVLVELGDPDAGSSDRRTFPTSDVTPISDSEHWHASRELAPTPSNSGSESLNPAQRLTIESDYSGHVVLVEILESEPSSLTLARFPVRVTMSTGWVVKLGQSGAVLEEEAPEGEGFCPHGIHHSQVCKQPDCL